MAKSLNVKQREAETLENWYKALDAEIGIEIKIESDHDFTEIASHYYAVRKAANDERLQRLSLIRSPFSRYDTFWLIKKAVDDE